MRRVALVAVLCALASSPLAVAGSDVGSRTLMSLAGAARPWTFGEGGLAAQRRTYQVAWATEVAGSGGGIAFMAGSRGHVMWYVAPSGRVSLLNVNRRVVTNATDQTFRDGPLGRLALTGGGASAIPRAGGGFWIYQYPGEIIEVNANRFAYRYPAPLSPTRRVSAFAAGRRGALILGTASDDAGAKRGEIVVRQADGSIRRVYFRLRGVEPPFGNGVGSIAQTPDGGFLITAGGQYRHSLFSIAPDGRSRFVADTFVLGQDSGLQGARFARAPDGTVYLTDGLRIAHWTDRGTISVDAGPALGDQARCKHRLGRPLSESVPCASLLSFMRDGSLLLVRGREILIAPSERTRLLACAVYRAGDGILRFVSSRRARATFTLRRMGARRTTTIRKSSGPQTRILRLPSRAGVYYVTMDAVRPDQSTRCQPPGPVVLR